MSIEEWSIFEEYRPRTWSEFLGNAPIKRMVQRMFRRGQTPKGVLVQGPFGAGKTTFARTLSRAITCESRLHGSPDPCNACDSCIRQEKYPMFGSGVLVRNCADLAMADVKSDLGLLLYAHDGPLVFLYDEFQRCKVAIQDLLITALEDPPLRFVLIVCTADPSIIEEPLAQRLVLLKLERPSVNDLVSLMARICRDKGRQFDTEVLRQICEDQERIPRRCLNALESLMLSADALTLPDYLHLQADYPDEVSP